MEITVAGQTWIFLMSVALGAALGVLYDVFRIVRIAVRTPPAVVLVEDLAFSIVCTTATFLFLIGADKGQLRMFLLIGEASGFALYYCTVGTLIIGAARGIIAVVKRICTFLEAAGVSNSALFGKVWIANRKNCKTIGKLSKTSRRKFEFALEKAQWDIV